MQDIFVVNLKKSLFFQAMKFNPGTQTWSVLIDQFLVEPVQGTCIVNIEDPEAGETLVLTGGTDKKITYVRFLRCKHD